ncbi:MAG: lytic transglycosylase domain-containing protein [Candidatus Acidiferrales bacterium]
MRFFATATDTTEAIRIAACAAGALMVAAILLAAPAAPADYAVLRSGARLHIMGYQSHGERVTLTIAGGAVEVAAADLVSIEPEETFRELPKAESAPAVPYGELIRAAAAKNGVDTKLLVQVIAAESNFNAKAVSRKRAQGLMQLMPATSARMAVRNVFDPAENIDAGARYLKQMMVRFSGNLTLALAAYNAGPEMVERYGGVPPFAETQRYVREILTAIAKHDSRPQLPVENGGL